MDACPRSFIPHFLNESLLWDFQIVWVKTHLYEEKQTQVFLKVLNIYANVAIS